MKAFLINVLFGFGLVIHLHKIDFLVTRTTPAARRAVSRTIGAKGFSSLLF